MPVARGGADVESNWVTTSMIRNSAKSNWTLEELGWGLFPKGNIDDWDGLLPWFVSYMERERAFLDVPYLRRWHRAAVTVPRTSIS